MILLLLLFLARHVILSDSINSNKINFVCLPRRRGSDKDTHTPAWRASCAEIVAATAPWIPTATLAAVALWQVDSSSICHGAVATNCHAGVASRWLPRRRGKLIPAQSATPARTMKETTPRPPPPSTDDKTFSLIYESGYLTRVVRCSYIS